MSRDRINRYPSVGRVRSRVMGGAGAAAAAAPPIATAVCSRQLDIVDGPRGVLMAAAIAAAARGARQPHLATPARGLQLVGVPSLFVVAHAQLGVCRYAERPPDVFRRHGPTERPPRLRQLHARAAAPDVAAIAASGGVCGGAAFVASCGAGAGAGAILQHTPSRRNDGEQLVVPPLWFSFIAALERACQGGGSCKEQLDMHLLSCNFPLSIDCAFRHTHRKRAHADAQACTR
eukprot:257926-Chlamydomonas_euryale.AAC.1